MHLCLRILILISVLLNTHAQSATTHDNNASVQNPLASTRKKDTSQTSDDWCFSHLGEDEKKHLESEMASIYSKYVANKNKEQFESSLAKIIENHTGSGDFKKGAAVGAHVFKLTEQLQNISRFTDALSKLSTGEKADDSQTHNQMKEIKADFEKLKSLGLSYDAKQSKWDFSGMGGKSISMGSLDPDAKRAFENLVSPEIAKSLFDASRKTSFSAAGMVFRPPQNGEMRAVTEEEQSQAVKKSIGIISQEKESFLEASKAANTYSNSMTGRISSWFGAERGLNGETSPEIARRSSLESMEKQLHFMQQTLGLKSEDVQPVYSAIQGAIAQDSRNIEELDRGLTEKINALNKTAMAVAAIAAAVATAGILAPAALTVVLGAGATTASFGLATAGATTSAIATAMAIPLALQAAVGAVNVGIESARHGTPLSCAAMNEVYQRGPNAVASAAISGVFPIAGGAAAGALGTAGRLLPQAVTGSQTLSRLGTTGTALGSLGLGGYFSYQGVNGLLQGQAQIREILKQAAEAEARGDKETAARLRTEAMKQGTELVANGAMEASGLRTLYRGARELRQPQANRAQGELNRKLTDKQRIAVEEAHTIGRGEPGADGNPAGVGNYTQDQLQSKYNKLAESGLTKPEIKILMDTGIVGDPLNYAKVSSQDAGKSLIGLANKQGVGSDDAIAIVRNDGAPIYQVNPKHVNGTTAYRSNRDNSLIPDNHVELYRTAKPANDGDYWAKDAKGNFHRFEQANGRVHWSGSTNLKKPNKPGSKGWTRENPDPIDFKNVPKEIKQMFN